MPRSAAAFDCTRVQDSTGAESGPSLSWFTREIAFTLHEAGTETIPGDPEFTTLRDSFAVWVGVEHCSPALEIPSPRTDIRFRETALSSVDRIGPDFAHPENNENLLIFRDAGWPMPGQDNVIALTTVSYNALTGEILDADIEFNSATFAFAVDGSRGKMDLMNTAVHEIGHVLGLDHTEVAGATMVASADWGETEKRSLECDDRNGVVFKYPQGQPNGYCEPASECGYCAPPDELSYYPTIVVASRDDGLGEGCGCAGGAGTGGLGALFVLGALAGARRRRR